MVRSGVRQLSELVEEPWQKVVRTTKTGRKKTILVEL